MKKYKIVKEDKESKTKKLPKKGYKFNPKTKLNGFKVKQITIVNNDMISKVIKRKIKYHLDQYLKIIIENMDNEGDNDSQKTLLDLKKYNKFILEKYSIYLDKKYMSLLNKRIGVIERELENNITYDIQEEHRRRR